MWLIILLFSALISTALRYSRADNDQMMLKHLSLIVWGASIMVFVDHVMGFVIEGGEFLETSIEAIVLGFIMLAVALIL